MTKYIENNELSTYTFNPRGLKAIIFIGVFSSLISIGFLVICGDVSLGFKVFFNFIWYPFIGLGYCISALAIGFDVYTHRHLTFKQYVYKNRFFYLCFYSCAVISIIVFIITLSVLRSTNSHLVELGVLANKNDPLLGWGTNPKNWYGFVFLYTLVPLANYNVIGTTFVVTLFWFNLFGFLIINFLNRVGFFWNTFLIVILVTYCFFSHLSLSVATENTEIGKNNPWLFEVFRYSGIINTMTLFYFGLYMRKYMRIWKFKCSVTTLVVLIVSAIVAQTVLDFTYYKKIAFDFILANAYASPLILILSWLWLNTFLGYNLESKKTKSKFIHQFNRFTNHIGFCYPIWFQLVGWTSTFIFGYLFINIIAKVDINPSWYQGLRLSFKLNADQNNAIFISLMFFNMFVVPVAYYYPAKFMVYLLNKIDHKIRTKRKNKLNK
ncbi:hypothetical domain protein [Mycoplasmoides gallisepticum str. F]|uniref:hypothetical protein n=1 Tax=Mycoplasmoides gallisepticum TaxID=2096 RepID=UPI0001C39A7A|nr:hypothetical protein [Mycoplasmoides gallisepticum]ADC31235.1 hypothetical domain protein [Mycoplasmoides gallisepticum str. F]